MKKLYAILSAVLFTSAAFAQPTFQASKFFTAGTTELNTDVDATGLSQGSAGANQTWSFTGLTAIGNPSGSTYANAAGTPYAGNFPAANIAGYQGGSYSYINRNASFIEFLGFGTYDSSTSSDIIITYSNPLRYSNFPVTFNTSTTDTYASSGSTTMSGITLTLYNSGTYSAVADAWGTLTTPTGTYPNCIRMRTVQIERDSIVYVGIPIPPVVSETHTYSYSWFDANGATGVNRFQISIDSTWDNTGALTSSGKDARYLSAVLTGVNEVSQVGTLNVYPNPTSDNITVSADEFTGSTAQLVIRDITGRCVSQSTVETGTSHEINIPVNYLAAGLYSITVSNENKNWTGRFIKK